MATKKPTGLVITRDGAKFKLTWKIGDKEYDDGQQLKHRNIYATLNGIKIEQKATAYSFETVTKKQTSKAVTISLLAYYPYTKKRLQAVQFAVRGDRHSNTTSGGKLKFTEINGWSEWADKSFMIYEPDKPTLTASLSDSVWNQTTFSWSYTNDTKNHKPFVDIEWQSILLKDCTETKGERLNWKSTNIGWRSGTTGATGSVPITEDTALITGKSYTRWLRVRARGAGGASDWAYAKHVYAAPYKAEIQTATAKELSNGTSVYVKWASTTYASKPIDTSTVEYIIATPLAGMTAPTTGWTAVSTLKDTEGFDAVSFIVTDTIEDDECLFVRVVNKHDKDAMFEVPSDPYLVKYGKLLSPNNINVTPDATTFEARIEADNRSTVPDSFLAVWYKTASNPSNAFIIGVIPSGSAYVDVQCPDFTGETITFGVYAVVGTYTQKTRSDGVTVYVVTPKMKSDIVWDGGQVPVAPTNVTAQQTDIEGTVRLSWDWTWSQATAADISWSDHADAWESTDEPQVYRIDSIHAAAWNVSNLEVGQTWYFRVRLVNQTADSETVGSWSEIVPCNLAEAPLKPSVELSKPIINDSEDITISWGYVSMDGTGQRSATIEDEDGNEIGAVETAQHLTVNSRAMGWTAGTVVNIRVKVTSASGQASEWSDYVPVTIAEPLNITMTTNLSDVTLTIDGEDETVKGLTALPLQATITGAGAGGTTSLYIERAESYFMDRPNETIHNGYEGEVMALVTQTGEDQIEINSDILLEPLDDGAWYRLVATVQDGFGQSAETSIDFIIKWSHQAIVPEATITLDNTIALITPTAPEDAETGDTVDIYRLSADRPELIYQGAIFGTTYVDPYPTIGYYGGYRIVYRTKDGDYITEDNQPAWTDYELAFDVPYSIFDFGGDQIRVLLNMNINSTWTKDFQETKYLGGAIQGDWNPAVSRSGSVSTYALKLQDPLTIEKARRLATYTGICHVRTIDGSSYAADIEVTEDYNFDNVARAFNFRITRVDSEAYDAVTLEQWEEQNS